MRVSDVKHIGESAQIATLAVSQLPEFFTWYNEQCQQVVAVADARMITPYETGFHRAVASKLYVLMEELNGLRNAYQDIMEGVKQ